MAVLLCGFLEVPPRGRFFREAAGCRVALLAVGVAVGGAFARPDERHGVEQGIV
ncbi:MAG: hypothetical protein OXH09_13895 [Gammaproteobacteria bacterium]|nr:hypothetical protein [Gammaproteobacteria bacterium]